MPTTANLGAQTETAHRTSLEVVRAQAGQEERTDRLEAISLPFASPTNAYHLAAFQAELIAALAELVEELDSRVLLLEDRISRLEKASTASAKEEKKKS